MSVGEGGRIVFSEFTTFQDNSSERGGALCNRGSTAFYRRSFFTGNSAIASGGETTNKKMVPNIEMDEREKHILSLW